MHVLFIKGGGGSHSSKVKYKRDSSLFTMRESKRHAFSGLYENENRFPFFNFENSLEDKISMYFKSTRLTNTNRILNKLLFFIFEVKKLTVAPTSFETFSGIWAVRLNAIIVGHAQALRETFWI